jgi:O-antigen/teichoic acid export membrane protein
LLLIPLAPLFIGLIYGVEFVAAVPLFQLLVGVMVFDVLLTPALLLPLAYQQPRLLAAGDAARAATLIGFGVALIPPFGAEGAIAARLASRVAGAVVVLGALWLGRATLEVQHEEAPQIAQQRQPT